MIIDINTYFDDFTPKFNQNRFDELMENTPTNFITPNGNINERKEFCKSVLMSCKLLSQELDRNNFYYGGEGVGKSHGVFQHTYIWWWFLTELGMINYEFSMKLIYARVKDIMEAMTHYKDIPYMIYSTDESDELNRKNWNKPNVKKLMSKLRKERKNLRVVNFIMPSLEEMLPSITLSRINWIIELDMELDDDFNVIRGDYKLLNIPVGKAYYNKIQQRVVTRKEIKSWLYGRLYNNDEKFTALPHKLVAIRSKFNKTFIFDRNEYKQWARDKNAEAEKEEDNSNESMLQRNKCIAHLLKLGLKQHEVGAICGLSRSAIRDIKQKMAALAKV